MVAGFFPHKGHLRVLKLARNFLDLGFQDFKIYMRGNKIYESYVKDIEKEIIESGLENFVAFEPFVRQITLKEIYAKFNLVLLLSEYEGFGLPVLEAQSYCVPVVCSEIQIFEEVLQDSAFYLKLDFTKDDVAKLIEKINEPCLMRNKIEEGLKNVGRFSWYKMSYDTLSLYKLFLKNN